MADFSQLACGLMSAMGWKERSGGVGYDDGRSGEVNGLFLLVAGFLIDVYF